jgi:hypothetical protein
MISVSCEKLYADLLDEQDILANELPPVEQWNPPLSGEIDIRIARDGTWYHEGEVISRPAIVRLFARILKREGNEYFLVTPVEKWRLFVDDVPLHVIGVQRSVRRQQQALVFNTMTGDSVLADAEHPVRVAIDPVTNEPSPYLMIRNGLEG